MKWLTNKQQSVVDQNKKPNPKFRKQVQFAWLPVDCSDGYSRWLERVVVYSEWDEKLFNLQVHMVTRAGIVPRFSSFRTYRITPYVSSDFKKAV
jgi:hypothetical protein